MRAARRSPPVGDVRDFPPGELRSVLIGDDEYLVVRLGDRFYALSNRCSHLGCFLSEGLLRGPELTCTCHGSKFDVQTGKVLEGPAEMDVPAYIVLVQGDKVHLNL